MKKHPKKRVNNYRRRINKSNEIPYKFNLKLFVALGLLLIILLMKKYDLSLGDFTVDRLYNVVYYNEDINTYKTKAFSIIRGDKNE